MVVERIIPPEILARLGKDLILSGGTIRIAPGFEGAGSIVRHLQFPETSQATNQILEQLKSTLVNNQGALNSMSDTMQGIQSLQQVTLAMQGMNLAISAAGFAIVLKKLNDLSQQLRQIDAKIDQLQFTADEIKHYQELIQTTRYHANLESLYSGVQRHDRHMISGATLNLREIQYLFQHVCDSLLQDLYSIYQNSSAFQTHFKAAFGSAMYIANAHAQLGEYAEAERVIDELSLWQKQIETRLLTPINSSKPIWLSRLSVTETQQAREATSLQQAIPENLLYTKNTYQLCREANVNLLELKAQNPDQILVIAP